MPVRVLIPIRVLAFQLPIMEICAFWYQHINANRQQVFSIKGCQIAIAYLAMKEHHIAIAYLAIKKCQIASNYLATKECQVASNHLVMLMTSCRRHQSKQGDTCYVQYSTY